MRKIIIAPASAGTPLRFLRTKASLPESYSSASGTPGPEAFSIDGNPEWAKQAAGLIEAGAKALVVSDPQVVAPEEVHKLIHIAEQYGAAVELAEGYAGDPALQHHGSTIRAHLEDVSALIVTENSPFSNSDSAALSIVRTSRALGRPVKLEAVRARPQAVFVIGRSKGLGVEGVVTRSSACVGQRVQGLGYSRTINIWLTGSDTARPAEITTATTSGETRFHTIYETAERTAWKRLHLAVTSAQNNNDALLGFAEDLTSVLTATT